MDSVRSDISQGTLWMFFNLSFAENNRNHYILPLNSKRRTWFRVTLLCCFCCLQLPLLPTAAPDWHRPGLMLPIRRPSAPKQTGSGVLCPTGVTLHFSPEPLPVAGSAGFRLAWSRVLPRLSSGQSVLHEFLRVFMLENEFPSIVVWTHDKTKQNPPQELNF